jgi:hypothetical protein
MDIFGDREMIGYRYIDEFDEVWVLEGLDDGYLLRRVSDGFLDTFDSLEDFDLLTHD